jgi:glycosyltransferase involved in cell wall biosynthesis
MLGWKGFSMGLAAFARLRRQVRDAEYLLVGDGPERPHLERLAHRLGCADAVRFLGWLPREDTLRLLADVDVLVHPSLHEQFGFVLLEAMAAGRPVLGLDVAGPHHVVGADGGILLPASSPAQVVGGLHTAMERLASNRGELLDRGRQARRWVQDTWTWDVVGRRMDAIYAETMRKTRCRK